MKKKKIKLNKEFFYALDISYQVHKDQKRDNGLPYLEEHIYPITIYLSRYLKQNKDILNILTIALLHDTVEDSDTVNTDTLRKYFSEKIVSSVIKLTKPKSSFSLEEYLNYIKSDPLALEVKVADRLNNLITTNISTKGKLEKYKRYIFESKNYFLTLANLSKIPNAYFFLNKEIKRLENQIFLLN